MLCQLLFKPASLESSLKRSLWLSNMSQLFKLQLSTMQPAKLLLFLTLKLFLTIQQSPSLNLSPLSVSFLLLWLLPLQFKLLRLLRSSLRSRPPLRKKLFWKVSPLKISEMLSSTLQLFLPPPLRRNNSFTSITRKNRVWLSLKPTLLPFMSKASSTSKK